MADPAQEPPRQNASAAAAPAPRPEPVPLSRVEERARINALNLAPGMSVITTFRAGETIDALAGEWCVDWQGVILDSEGEPGQERWRVIFRQGEQIHQGFLPTRAPFELAAVAKLRVPQSTVRALERPDEATLKRLRTEANPETKPVDTKSAAIAETERLYAIYDTKQRKVTAPVLGGEGLRIVVACSAPYDAANPIEWFNRLRDSDPSSTAAEWRNSWKALLNHVGKSFPTPAIRDQYFLSVENTINAIFGPAPNSKARWRTVFANAGAAVHLILLSAHGEKVATAFSASWKSAFEDNQVDVELLIRNSEPQTVAPTTVQPNGPADPRDAELSALRARLRQMEESLQSAPSRNFRRNRGFGRAANRGARGRGGQGGRARGRGGFTEDG